MGLYSQLFALGAVLSTVLGLSCLGVAMFYDFSGLGASAGLLSAAAWFLTAVFLLRERALLSRLKLAAQSIGVPDVSGGLSDVVASFVRETTRYHRAAYATRLDSRLRNETLSQSLWRSVTLAYREFSARSVELALMDEEAEQWSRAMIIGSPSSTEAQSMLGFEDRRATKVHEDGGKGLVVSKPVSFAGTVFGVLKIELEPGVELDTSDRKVLHLLTTQVGILLADSRFTEEVLKMRRLSDETTRVKTGFLANLSHEIRGPLGIILNGIELALDGLCGELTPELEETLTMVKDSGAHLLDLVNDVLDYAKVEAGKVTITPTEIVLSHLLEDLSAIIRSQASSKGHEVILEEVDRTLGVVCDKRHIRQMLINFLTNAVKYTPDGGTITISASRTKENRVKISVKDTGIGIPEDQRSKVFGAFERVENSYALKQVGAGLGMPLTRRLAEVNGGSVGFDSKHGEGSTFWVILPAVTIEGASLAPGENADEVVKDQGRGEAVLLVDHEDESRGMLEKYLGDQGFKVVLASSGVEVLKFLREQKIELAIVENDMPDLSGEEMVSAIRSTPNARTMPIILLSTHAFVFDIERFLKLGVDRCLSKPLPLGELALTVRRLIDESRALDT